MDEDQRIQFEEAMRKVDEMYEHFQQTQHGAKPVDDSQRITNGIGFIGRTTDTTPGGALIVNSPEGPIKVLIV